MEFTRQELFCVLFLGLALTGEAAVLREENGGKQDACGYKVKLGCQQCFPSSNDDVSFTHSALIGRLR